MIIKSNNIFKVNRGKLIKNAENIVLPCERKKKDYIYRKTYGDSDSMKYGSYNSLHARLHGHELTLSLSSDGGMCGFEFDTETVLPFDVKKLGDLEDLTMMVDVIKLLSECVIEEVE